MTRQRKKLQKISHLIGTAVALLGVTGLSVIVNYTSSPLNGFFEIPLRAVVSALSAFILATWRFLVPCVLGHTRLLECLLEMTTCGWQIFLAFAGAA